jgi:hypothetical protein
MEFVLFLHVAVVRDRHDANESHFFVYPGRRSCC